MLAIVNVVIPVFALMALGYLAVRFKLFPTEGARGLVVFVNSFATPCLLFQALLTSDFSTTFNLAVIIPFYIGAFCSFVLGAVIGVKFFGNRPGEGVSAGFSAMFTNTILVGIPIMTRAYGEPALATTFSIIAFHASVLITVGMVAMELVRRDGAPIYKALGIALLRILKNPLMWGVVAGYIGNTLQITLIEPADAFFSMMAAAVTPVALFGLGAALNEYKLADNWAEALAISLLKLVLQPAIAWVLLVPVLNVDHELARYAVVLAAMPTGINAYVFASYYNRGLNVATNAILISTTLSIVTVSFWLFVMGL